VREGRPFLNAHPYRLGAVPPTGNPPLGYPDPVLSEGDCGECRRAAVREAGGVADRTTCCAWARVRFLAYCPATERETPAHGSLTGPPFPGTIQE
jgi:hypothetical protein